MINASKINLKNIKLLLIKDSSFRRNKMQNKWAKCTFFKKKKEWRAIFEAAVRQMVGKGDAIKKTQRARNSSELRSFFDFISQYDKITPKLSSLNSPLRPFLLEKIGVPLGH